MAKSGDADMSQLGSDATQVIGPIRKLAEDAFKMATLMAKNPNPKVAEALAGQIEEIISSAGDLKDVLKDLKAAAK